MTTFEHVGLSGCNIQLIGDSIIRKTSPTVKYNARLERQMEKQNAFVNTDHIFAPEVFDVGSVDGLYYFDMEYVNGKLFNEEFQGISKAELDSHVRVLFEYLDGCHQEYYREEVLQPLLMAKLLSLREKSQHKDLIDYSMGLVINKEIGTIPFTFCHGDLTLSNVLFVNSNLCFLDFLDSYIDSFVMDIVKLKQDLYYGWYLNFLPVGTLYVTRTKQVLRYLWEAIESEYNTIVNSDLFHVLDLVNFLRIEPYTNSEVLHRMIGETVIYENFNHPNDGEVN